MASTTTSTVPLPLPVRKQRLDAAFPWASGSPLQRNLQRLMAVLESRLAWLEYTMYEGQSSPETILADTIQVVNDIMAPLTADLQDAAALGFLMAQSATETTLQIGTNVELTLLDGPGRRMFQATPFVFLTHAGGDYTNWCAARVSDLNRETGVLTVRPLHIEGSAGPWSEWDITASAAMPAAVEVWAAQIEADVTTAYNNATNAAASAGTAQSLKSSIFARYLGGRPANPTLDDEGNAIPDGSMYWNTGIGELRIKSGGTWAQYSPASVAASIFTDLNDVPENYTGSGGKHVRVKASVDGLEFTDAPYTKAEADARYDATGAAAAVDATLDGHIADQGNPHATTKTQVGLGSVTNDAQLKRAANDWAGFAAKTVPADSDAILVEDSEAGGAKKTLTYGNTKAALQTYFDSLYVAGAPAGLNTFDELAAAIGDDASFATTVTTALGTKAGLASPTFTGHPAAPTQAAKSNNTDLATCAYVDAAVIPSTTRAVFQQTNAPTGWTKITTHNDKTLRVVSGTVGSGGATAFSSVFGTGKTVGGTSITQANLPAVNLTSAYLSCGTSNGQAIWTGNRQSNNGSGGNGGSPYDTGQASLVMGGYVPLGGSGTTHTHSLSLDLQYVDIIIASKD